MPVYLTTEDGDLLLTEDGSYLLAVGVDEDGRLAAPAAPALIAAGPPDYLQALQALQLTGIAWPTEPDAVLTRLLAAIADGLARLDERARQLLEEADPRTTWELFEAWEADAGLPDACAGAEQTLPARRAALLARLTGRGGATPAYLIGLAAQLGYSITIEEPQPFRCNGSECNVDLLNGPDWANTFIVHAPAVTEFPFRCNESGCGEPLLDFGDDLLECAIGRAKPAHTHAIFAYGGQP
jgi:uncharacterized protein YmfQ (DUF2313 family)